MKDQTQRIAMLRHCRGVSLLALAAGFSALLADPVQAAPDAANDEHFGIEEITVTARKREEKLQDTPVSIVVLSGEDIARRQIVSLADVGQHAPNVQFHASGVGGRNSGQAFIRGVGQSDYLLTTDPGIGVYVDGVYLARSMGSIFDLVDIERIEVLRGPQGTLYGKNTIGGAINIVSTKPSLTEASGMVEGRVGRFSRLDVKAKAEVPLIADKLAAKVALSTRDAEGFGTRLLTGEEQGSENSAAVQASLRWKADEDVEVMLSFDKTRVRETFSQVHLEEISEAPLVGLYNMFVAPYDASYITENPYESYATGGNRNDLDVWGVNGTLEWSFGNTTLKSITAYRHLKSVFETDPDGSPLTIVDERDDNRQRQFTQELQLSGTSFDDRLKWVVGAYYLHENARGAIDVLIYPELLPVIGLDISRRIEAKQITRSTSLYGQASYALADGLNATLGLRYTHEKKRYDTLLYLPFSDVYLIDPTRRSQDWNSVSPRFGLDYRLTPEVMVYASAASGFKSGGFNGRSSTANEVQPYVPEKLWSYELGLKSDWLDNRLRINLAGFYNDYRDIQFMLSTADEDGVQVVVVQNAAKARVMGAELEVTAAPAPRLLLSASAGLIDAEFTDVAAGAAITTASHFASTPKFSSSVSAEYGVPLGDWGTLTLRGDYNYRSRIYYEVNNLPAVTQNGYGLLNLQATLEPGDGRYALTLAMTNVTDKRYKSTAVSTLDSLGFASAQYGRPREWSLTTRVRF
ncbi:TonB-dependent receptor [Sphingosinicella sp.]|uniref:TonB-dependent receptor n=1 Tax=Sphingosinicella sp. TaxID=1917971 RepID=UPI0035B153DD